MREGLWSRFAALRQLLRKKCSACQERLFKALTSAALCGISAGADMSVQKIISYLSTRRAALLYLTVSPKGKSLVGDITGAELGFTLYAAFSKLGTLVSYSVNQMASNEPKAC